MSSRNINLKHTTLSLRDSINLPVLRRSAGARLLIAVALVSFALLPGAPAVSPPPDGGYSGGNTAEGQNALLRLTTGGYNTGVGFFSLSSNSAGSFNTALGAGTLLANTGEENTAVGGAALLSNTTGTLNTASGASALVSNTTGMWNTANGNKSLFRNTSGGVNTALGYQAGYNATTGSGNVYIGAGTYGSEGEENHTYIRNISGTTVNGGSVEYVTIDLSTGLLGHLGSSRRYKEEIKPMDKASEALYRLKPVSYRYKKDIDSSESFDYGLIAEDVVKVDPNLAIRDGKGQVESVRYNAVNAMLLNEFLKEHKKVEEQQATIAELKSTVAQQQESFAEQRAQIQALASDLQKISAQMEMNKSSATVVVNTP